MKTGLFVLAALGLMFSATVLAQEVLNLSGQFRCVQGCEAGLVNQPVYVAQRGWDLRLLNEAGVPARAWIDRPGHLWVQSWNEGAVYSADGMTIWFRRGTVWEGARPRPMGGDSCVSAANSRSCASGAGQQARCGPGAAVTGHGARVRWRLERANHYREWRLRPLLPLCGAHQQRKCRQCVRRYRQPAGQSCTERRN